MSDVRKRAVVIGSGFGGLAIAARLQAAGMDVTLCVFRPNPSTSSGAFRPPVPEQGVHRFR